MDQYEVCLLNFHHQIIMISSKNNVQKYCKKGHEQVLNRRKNISILFLYYSFSFPSWNSSTTLLFFWRRLPKVSWSQISNSKICSRHGFTNSQFWILIWFYMTTEVFDLLHGAYLRFWNCGCWEFIRFFFSTRKFVLQ